MIQAIAFKTIYVREVRRFFRIWPQTLLPPAITITLYFVIFGQLIGSQIRDMNGFAYIQYIAPGLIMMSVINNAYNNVVSSFYGAKFQKSIEELLVAPVASVTILLGFIAGGMTRGLLVGCIVASVALFFTQLTVAHIGMTFLVILLTAMIFSMGGMINAIFARSFDDISIIPTFVLTPLTYLGGVFYSIDLLSGFWREVTMMNPIWHMIDMFRYAILGVSQSDIIVSMSVMAGTALLLFLICWLLLARGVGIKT